MKRESPRITPLYILSLPRTGSTLLQLLLSSHPAVATVSEPWILLPLLHSLKADGHYAAYGNAGYRRALEDFWAALPEGRDDYHAALREAVRRLYERAGDPEARYFLDKTPRYSLIAPEILSCFPDAHIIVLWRNPLAIAASIIRTWGDSHWNLYRYKVDLFRGLSTLVDLCRENPGRISQLRYEDLVTDPASACGELLRALDLSPEQADLEKIRPEALDGRMGDPTIHERATVSRDSLTGWSRELATPLRRAWALRYLEWIGAERLRVMGYEKEKLREQLTTARLSLRALPSDIWQMTKGLMHPLVEPSILRAKLRKLGTWSDIVSHS